MFSYYTVEKTNNGYQYVRQRRQMVTSPSKPAYNKMESPRSPPFSYAALERCDSESENQRSSRYWQHEPSQSQGVRDQRCRHKYRSGKDTQDDSHKRRGGNHRSSNSSSRQFSQSYSSKCDGNYGSKQYTPTSENDNLQRCITSLTREVQDLQTRLAACADSSQTTSSELRHYKKDVVPRLREKIRALTAESNSAWEKTKARDSSLRSSAPCPSASPSRRSLEKVTTSLAAAEAELDKVRDNGHREYEKRKKAQSEIARLRGEVNAWETRYEALYQARSVEKHKLEQEIQELQEKVQDCGSRIQGYVDRLNLYEPLLKREGYLRDS